MAGCYGKLASRQKDDDQLAGAPALLTSGETTRQSTFASLQIPNFRLFAASQVLSNTGAWMQRVAQDWVVLELTNSPTAVGITTAMQFLPMLVFGLFGGLIADRYPKRRLLLVTQSCAGLLAATLALLILSGTVAVWEIYLVAFLLGLVTVVDNPTRQLFVNEMVGPRYLRNAISLNSSVFQLGGLIGPAISGLLINVVGAGWSFAINALSYTAVLTALTLINTDALTPIVPTPRAPGQLREGLAYVAGRPQLIWPIVLVACVGSIGLNMPIVLSTYAKNVFHTGPGGYGLLNSMLALGSMGGALFSARRTSNRLRSLVAAAGVFGGLEAVTALAPNPETYALLLVAVGAAALTFLTAANSGVQLATEDTIRGRVMSLYMLVLIGGTPIGAPVIGLVTEHIGPRYGMLTCGTVPALAAVAVALWLKHSARLQLRIIRHPLHARQLITVGPRFP